MDKKKPNWSLAEIQDMVFEKEWGEKKSLYASDSDKCLCGVYYSLIGEKPTVPEKPESLRRMDVGNLVEYNQIKKLKSLGIFLDAQSRIYDEEYKVSGRPDGIIISPTHCTAKAKRMIERKKEIFVTLQEHGKNFYKGLEKFRSGEITKDQFIEGRNKLNLLNDKLFDEESEINQELLEPNPKNSLMLLEIKSINEWGFKYRLREGKPMDTHVKQLMFYYWKLREKYPNILARILYVQLPYQDLLEFDVEYDENIINSMKEVWRYVWDCVEKKTPPVAIPNVIRNPMSGKWQVNGLAEWCRYHNKCCGNDNWLGEAIGKVKQLNSGIGKKQFKDEIQPEELSY